MFSFLYNAGKLAILRGDVQPLVDVLKVALVGSGYSADKDAHAFFADLSAEVSGSGYTAGGQALSDVSLTQDDANDRVVLSAAASVWPVASFSARGAVLYKDSGSRPPARCWPTWILARCTP